MSEDDRVCKINPNAASQEVFTKVNYSSRQNKNRPLTSNLYQSDNQNAISVTNQVVRETSGQFRKSEDIWAKGVPTRTGGQ